MAFAWTTGTLAGSSIDMATSRRNCVRCWGSRWAPAHGEHLPGGVPGSKARWAPRRRGSGPTWSPRTQSPGRTIGSTASPAENRMGRAPPPFLVPPSLAVQAHLHLGTTCARRRAIGAPQLAAPLGNTRRDASKLAPSRGRSLDLHRDARRQGEDHARLLPCERSGRIAIELANAAESDTRSGLYPKQMPKLFCDPRSTAPRIEIASTWFVSELGDALTRGLAPSVFRRCAAVQIVQDLALPRGWGAETKHVEIEVIPYKKEIDEVLATCARDRSSPRKLPRRHRKRPLQPRLRNPRRRPRRRRLLPQPRRRWRPPSRRRPRPLPRAHPRPSCPATRHGVRRTRWRAGAATFAPRRTSIHRSSRRWRDAPSSCNLRVGTGGGCARTSPTRRWASSARTGSRSLEQARRQTDH